MGQIKIYPATKEQAENIQTTVDEINAKIVTPNYQVKTVTPSNIQQTVQADTGYTALSGVVVNPIAALMPENLEDYIMRNERTEKFSISVNGSIPEYACYSQRYLEAVYGDLSGTIGSYAFLNCTNLQTIDARNVTLIGSYAFLNCTNLQTIDARNVTLIGEIAFKDCTNLQSIDIRNAASIGYTAFAYCANLQFVDTRNVNSIKGYAFQKCGLLQLVDCTSRTTPPTIESTSFTSTNDNFRVVVATDTEKALFQAATNWSVRASQIYTVAEIEALVGMTYDEYYLQIFGHARNEVQP